MAHNTSQFYYRTIRTVGRIKDLQVYIALPSDNRSQFQTIRLSLFAAPVCSSVEPER